MPSTAVSSSICAATYAVTSGVEVQDGRPHAHPLEQLTRLLSTSLLSPTVCHFLVEDHSLSTRHAD